MPGFAKNNPNAAYRKGVAITLDAAFGESDAINVTGAGNINVTWPDDTTSVIAVAVGTTKIAIKKIATASTTATGLTALYL